MSKYASRVLSKSEEGHETNDILPDRVLDSMKKIGCLPQLLIEDNDIRSSSHVDIIRATIPVRYYNLNILRISIFKDRPFQISNFVKSLGYYFYL